MKKTVLFVDDENNLLNGLQRMLRVKADEWEMEFVDSGDKALENLKKKNYDIIVTDYKMPGMNGLVLLEKVKGNYPKIKRFLLTGQSEMEIFEKAKGVVDVYISKPCNAEELISNIDKS
ncbi:MAG: response regulator [Spirochaetota bacterium]|nr:response regulator [Spirochaetota bacterium]